jgi:hypothetical protein
MASPAQIKIQTPALLFPRPFHDFEGRKPHATPLSLSVHLGFLTLVHYIGTEKKKPTPPTKKTASKATKPVSQSSTSRGKKGKLDTESQTLPSTSFQGPQMSENKEALELEVEQEEVSAQVIPKPAQETGVKKIAKAKEEG